MFFKILDNFEKIELKIAPSAFFLITVLYLGEIWFDHSSKQNFYTYNSYFSGR